MCSKLTFSIHIFPGCFHQADVSALTDGMWFYVQLIIIVLISPILPRKSLRYNPIKCSSWAVIWSGLDQLLNEKTLDQAMPSPVVCYLKTWTWNMKRKSQLKKRFQLNSSFNDNMYAGKRFLPRCEKSDRDRKVSCVASLPPTFWKFSTSQKWFIAGILKFMQSSP